MKKILISILIILILTLAFVALRNGISIGFIKINSIEDVKNANAGLNNDFNIANHLVNITYLEEIDKLESAITRLKSSKQEYENKNLYNKENEALGTVQIKTYTIHYLWTILGNYSNDRNLQSLNIDLKSGQGEGIYDLDFTLIGNYVGITDFIYDIENDEELNFEIQNFKISSQIAVPSNNVENTQSQSENNTTQTSKQETKASDGNIIQATFTVKNVGVTLE